MSLEDDLRDSLERRARTVAPAANVADVHARATGRDRQTRRLLVAGLAVALLAGPLIGFAAGQTLADEPGAAVSAGSGGATTPTTVVTSPEELAQSAASPILPLGTGALLEPLFRRTTDDGIVIRAYRQPLCEGTDLVTAGLSNEAAVTQTFGTAPGQDELSVSASGVFGVAEGSAAWWVTVGVGTEVTRVRAEVVGASDQMEAVDGVAILAGAFADDATTLLPWPQITVEGLDSSGAVVSSVEIGPGSIGRSYLAVGRCPPGESSRTPTTLPPPGEQPADAASAREQIERAYTTMHDGTKTEEERLSALVAGHGLTDLFRQVTATYPEGVAASSGRVTDIVFTSPTEATVLYDILSYGTLQFAGRLGGAVLVDGRWRITRETACSELLLAEVSCLSG